MKKIILFIMLIFIFPIKISALEYNSILSGDETISVVPDDSEVSSRLYRNLYINITNIENISSFDMYIKYDNSLIGLSTCNLLNYISTGCHMSSNKEVYYQYRYSDGYSSMINNYNFYRVGFMPIESTPDSGTTTVEVYFKNAKDKDSNPITIKSSNKTYTFSKYGMSIKKNEEDNSEKQTENNNEQPTNDNSNNLTIETITKKSDNNYINKLEIKNYNLNFLKDKNDYSIEIDNEVNNLDITVILDDNNSTYEIIGTNDLKANNYKVSIEVTSESGIKNIYTINAKIKNENKTEENILTPSAEIKEDTKKITFNKNYLIYSSIGLLLIILIITFISYINNKKIDKSFKGL